MCDASRASAGNARQSVRADAVPTEAQPVAPEEPLELPSQYSEERLAAEFTRLYSAGWKYVAEFARWMWWDGFRWRPDLTLQAYDFARELVRYVSAHAYQNPELSRSQQKRVG